MSAIEQQVRRARRQLQVSGWLGRLGVCLAVGSGVFVILTAVVRGGGLEWPLATAGWALLAVSTASSVIWTALRGESPMVAAVALDEAAGLAERVSTGLYCGDADDPFFQAVRADAERRVAGLNVRVHLPVRWPVTLSWGSSAVAFSLLVYWLLPVMDLFGRQQTLRERELAAQQAEVRRDAVVQQVAQLKMLREAAPVLKENEEFTDELDIEAAKLDTVMDPRRENVRMLEHLTEAVEKQRDGEAYEALEEMKKMMRRLRDPQASESPVSELSEALAQGDFKEAREALNRLADELAKAGEQGNREQVEKLQQQLDELGKKLEKLAAESKKIQDTLEQAGISREDMEKILEALKKNDLSAVKDQLSAANLSAEQVADLAKKLANRQMAERMCSRMGTALSQAASLASASSGEGEGMAALAAAADMLSQAEQLSQEMAQLDAALAQLGNMKNQSGKACSSCAGSGCRACNGTGTAETPGQGMGILAQGSGGLAPEQQTQVGFKMERTPVETTPGGVIGELLIEGSQFKREAMAEFSSVFISAEDEATQAIARDKVPPYARQTVKQYFSRGRAEVTGRESQATSPDDSSK